MPCDLLATVPGRQTALRERQRQLEAAIDDRRHELQALGVELAAMGGHPHLGAAYEATRTRLDALSDELAGLRAELTRDATLLEALDRYAERIRLGESVAPRAHLRRPHEPVSEPQLRAAGLAELWAALSIGVMLVGVVALSYFARQYLVIGLIYAVVLFVVIEAGFRGRIGRLIAGVTVVLAIVSAAVLLYAFFWPIAVALIILLGLYILGANLRELRR